MGAHNDSGPTISAAVAEGVCQVLAIFGQESGSEEKARLEWVHGAEPDRWVLFLTIPEAIEEGAVSGFMLRVIREVDPLVLSDVTLDFGAPELDD